MFRWFRRLRQRRLDRLCVRVVDRIQELYEVHRPAGSFEDELSNSIEFQSMKRNIKVAAERISDQLRIEENKRSTFTVAELAHIKMKNPQRIPPNQKRNRK